MEFRVKGAMAPLRISWEFTMIMGKESNVALNQRNTS